jgi:Tfp pilus assembly major pilin PilA
MSRTVTRRHRAAGYSLVELVAAVGIIATLSAVGVPYYRAYMAEAQLVGAGRAFTGAFRRARSMAVKQNAYTAIRFTHRADGDYYAIYRDGNANGVTSADIERGIDVMVEAPRRLDGGLSGVRVGINPDTPAIPPDRGTLDTADPIRFGRSNMLSFSPLGTATPGTFYLAGPWAQAAVRVTPGSSRVRMLTCRGRKWTDRG